MSLYVSHPRHFDTNRFVYPVVSRRSRGVSNGVNLNPDKVCNFDCIYCQVNRVERSETRYDEMDAQIGELDAMLALVTSGGLYEHEPFNSTPPPLRRLNDIAFSGDGEPTTYRNFDEIIATCAELKRKHGLDAVKMVLITNASMFHRPTVERGLAILDANQGEIWAKLDAGTELYYKLIERTTIPFQQILDNITAAARVRPLENQSLIMRVHGEAPAESEIDAFSDRLNEITAAGGQLSLIQIYTVARPPAESFVTPLTNGEMDAIAARVHSRTGLNVVVFQ